VKAQDAVLGSIQHAAADFLSFYPDALTEVQPAKPVYVVIGSERGFCGDFNQSLIRELESQIEQDAAITPAVIVIGRKLYSLLESSAQVDIALDGASVAEEVLPVLERIVLQLSSMQNQYGVLDTVVIYHADQDNVMTHQLLPPFHHLDVSIPRYTSPPVLNVEPGDFLAELSEHYLFAALMAMLYASLDTENHHRVSHLEGAINHLDDESEVLGRQCNSLRQEEIIEEIEVILISAGNTDGSSKRGRPKKPLHIK
jgi:F-type H+-transporting ATPase subunit gamma